jgi:hypothetical protein
LKEILKLLFWKAEHDVIRVWNHRSQFWFHAKSEKAKKSKIRICMTEFLLSLLCVSSDSPFLLLCFKHFVVLVEDFYIEHCSAEEIK